jgi:hypothetical protein
MRKLCSRYDFYLSLWNLSANKTIELRLLFLVADVHALGKHNSMSEASQQQEDCHVSLTETIRFP